MNPLDELELEIPTIESDPELMKAARSAYDDTTWSIISLQGLLDELLKEADGPGPTPENLAWIIFWTRVHQALQGLRGAISRRSLLTCQLLQRTLLEEAMQLTVICRPMTDNSLRMSRLSRKRVVEGRMAAYLAWCLWRDLEAWRRFLHPANLRQVFDPAPARDFDRRLGDAPDLLRLQFETLTDAEAELLRGDATAFATRRVAFLENLLSDPRLAGQAEELEHRQPKSFFELLDGEETSMWKVFAAQDIRFVYSVYQEGSSAAHGSSLENTLFESYPVVAPRLGASDDELERHVALALNLAKTCAKLLLHLKI